MGPYTVRFSEIGKSCGPVRRGFKEFGNLTVRFGAVRFLDIINSTVRLGNPTVRFGAVFKK